jgi:guanylate kinase
MPVILSSPSGAGKTAIKNRLLELRSDVDYSVSCTTRPARADERDGDDYYFLTPTEFVNRQERGEFAEYATVHGHLYGTLRAEVTRVMGQGKHVVMDIDVQGAAQFRKAFPDSILIFVLPPSAEAMLGRLRGRGSESQRSLAARLASALVELQAVNDYHYVVVNDDGQLERAVEQVSGIIDSEGLRRERMHDLEQEVRALIERLEHEVATYNSAE